MLLKLTYNDISTYFRSLACLNLFGSYHIKTSIVETRLEKPWAYAAGKPEFTNPITLAKDLLLFQEMTGSF